MRRRERWSMRTLTAAGGFVAVFAVGVGVIAGESQAPTHLLPTVDLNALERLVTRAAMLPALPAPADFGLEQIDAFEENYKFIYFSGLSRLRTRAEVDTIRTDEVALRRTVFVLKPSILVIEDRLPLPDGEAVAWNMQAPYSLASFGGTVMPNADGGRFRCKCVLPEAVAWTFDDTNERQGSASHLVARPEEAGDGSLRILHVMSFRGAWNAALPECSASREDSSLRLKMVAWDELTDRNRIVHLTLAEGTASSRVKIVGQDGYVEVAERLLPAGKLPPGERGVELQEQWDMPYRNRALATWDTGRPSSELKRLVESGTIQPCRTIEFGCGTGNDAIYLASKGFDVTAIDVSPTALGIAEKKAKKAGVAVRWMLADVLEPPQLQEFDLVYDRGCYHEVRRRFAKEYVAAVRRVTHSGSRVLILAGNANKDSYWRFHGPPRVKEEEIRGDFIVENGFRIVRLKEFRFDPAPPDQSGALAWSVSLERE